MFNYTESEISENICDLLPRDGSVNVYGSHLAESESEQNEDHSMTRSARSETRESQVVCFAYIFPTIFENVFCTL